MPRKPKSAGDRVVEALTSDLGEDMEWSEVERLTLARIRTAVDRAVVLQGLLDVEVVKEPVSTRRVAELASEIRQLDANVVRWSAMLDPTGEATKSARHQAAANARWHRGAVVSHPDTGGRWSRRGSA